MAQKYYPSIKRIVDTFHVGQETASVARKIMDGTIIPYSQSRYAWDNVENINILHCPKTAAWVGQCCNAPSLHEVKMHILDEMLGSYGVEFINLEPDNYRWPKGIEYLNMGDTYTPTLIYFNNRYSIGCWGDYLEYWERKHGQVN